eukprot:g20289.t1
MMWCSLLAIVAVGSMAAPSLEAALESDTECTSESCAVNALQVDSTKTQANLSAGDGAVHCLCKDREDKQLG